MKYNPEQINELFSMYNDYLKYYGYDFTVSRYSILDKLNIVRWWYLKHGINFETDRTRYNSPVTSFTLGSKNYKVTNPVDFRSVNDYVRQ